jgi:hypothetical protein
MNESQLETRSNILFTPNQFHSSFVVLCCALLCFVVLWSQGVAYWMMALFEIKKSRALVMIALSAVT